MGKPRSAVDKALSGLGTPQAAPEAPGRAWSGLGGVVQPPSPVDNVNRVLRISKVEETLLGLDAQPLDVKFMTSISTLPTKATRKKVPVIGFWDLEGARSIAEEFKFRVETSEEVDGMELRWLDWRIKMEMLKNVVEGDVHVDGLKTELRKFQARGCAWLEEVRRCLLGDQMGLGKSIQILGTILRIRQKEGGRVPTMILAPTSVVGDWKKKFDKFTDLKLAVAEGTIDKRKKVYASKPEFLGLSYDIFMRDLLIIVQEFHAHILVADECQRVTNRKAMVTQKLFEYVDMIRPAYRFMVSGSPIMNEAQDLWPILRVINTGLAGTATGFETRYLEKEMIWKAGKDGKPRPMEISYGHGKNVKKFKLMRIKGAKNLKELKAKLDPFVLRRLKKDVAPELPAKSHEELWVNLGLRERKVYDELRIKFTEVMAGVSDEEEETGTTILEWFMKAQQVCDSLMLMEEPEEVSSKMKELKILVHDQSGGIWREENNNIEAHWDFDQSEKMLIFSRFRKMTELIFKEFDICKKHKKKNANCHECNRYNPLHLHGGVPQKKRQGLVDSFQEDPKHRLFVSTLKAGGVGLNLGAAAIVVRYDRWFSPAANEQAEDRAHRLDSPHPVTVIDIIVRDSIEERVLEIIEKKKKLIGSLMSDDQVTRKLFRHKADAIKLF